MPHDPPAWFTDALAAPVTVGEVAVDGVAIRYRSWGEPGDGAGLVLVHGGAAHSRWWDHVAPLLTQGRRRVMALDLSGHGDSGEAQEYGLSSWAEQVMAVAGHGGAGDLPVVIGHSMGGWVALAAALRHGERLTGSIVIDSPIRDRSPEERAARRRRAFGPVRTYPDRESALAHFRLVPEQPGDLPYVHAHIAEHSIRPAGGGWRWKFDRRMFAGMGLTPGQLGTAACRVALFRAQYGLVPADMGEMVVDRLGRVAPLVEIPGAGHHMMVDQPLALVTGLRAMLADWEHSTPVPVGSRSRDGGRDGPDPARTADTHSN